MIESGPNTTTANERLTPERAVLRHHEAQAGPRVPASGLSAGGLPASQRPATELPASELPTRHGALRACHLCGAALFAGGLVADGGNACADVRWYCRDVEACTKRWTASLTSADGAYEDAGA